MYVYVFFQIRIWHSTVFAFDWFEVDLRARPKSLGWICVSRNTSTAYCIWNVIQSATHNATLTATYIDLCIS